MRWTRRFSVMTTAILFVCAMCGSRVSAAPSATMSAHRALNFTCEIAKFDNVPLDTVIDYIHDETQANIHVNWKALEGAGVGKDSQVNLNLRKVPVHKLLDLALEEAGAGTALTFYVDQGVIEITTRELADSSMITRVYPVDDLLMVIPDFTDAPDFNISSNNTQTSGGGGGGGGGSSGGGSGGGLFGGSSSSNGGQQQQQFTTKTDRAQQLIDLIMQVIQPDIWQPNGGQATIHYLNGSLVVRAPRSVLEALGGPVD